MKQYPSIETTIVDCNIYAFDKLDGSNIRAEWSKKRGFYKFGSRHVLIDEKTDILGESVGIVKSKYEKDLSDIFIKNKYESAICFFEFYGANSFAGNHDPKDIKTATLFDVNPYKKGFLGPKQFIDMFGHLDIPKVLYQGKANKIIIQQVRDSMLPEMTFEGVVCKGGDKHDITMFKIKSLAWLTKLKNFCQDNIELFNKLQ